MNTTVTDHIDITIGICGGKPRIANTRIRVQDIVIWTEQGETPDDIVAGYPHLSLADVHAALAYYYDHREDIDQQIKESEQFVATMKVSERAVERTVTPREADADSLSPG